MYSVLGIRTKNGKTEVKIYNPWGPNDRGQNPPRWVSIDKVRKSINGVSVSGG